MTLPLHQKRIAIELLLEKSDRNLLQATDNVKLGHWDLIANRLYYSVFHAVTALMMNDGIVTHTHKGTSSQFGRYYVLTGKFERGDGLLYSRLQSMREKADYQNVFHMTEEEVLDLIEKTRHLQSRIKEFIRTSLSPDEAVC